jgi:hypothetical protein
VSVASVVKWSQRFRATGSAAAKPMGGRRPYALEGERDWLPARVGEAPDLTLRALATELAARGILVSHYAAPRSVPTTSETLDMLPPKTNLLYSIPRREILMKLPPAAEV